MITAKEAGQLTKCQKSEEALSELECIEELIRESANCGNDRVCIDGSISETARIALKEAGYRITNGSQYNEPYTTIDWSIDWEKD